MVTRMFPAAITWRCERCRELFISDVGLECGEHKCRSCNRQIVEWVKDCIKKIEVPPRLYYVAKYDWCDEEITLYRKPMRKMGDEFITTDKVSRTLGWSSKGYADALNILQKEIEGIEGG